MGKEVEGKGRQKQLERDDQYEEARALLTDALALYPPNVYRAGLYRDLCICNTKLRMQEEAAKACEQHFSVDSHSAASRLLLAEALLLAEQYDAAIGHYRKVRARRIEHDDASQHEQQHLPYLAGARGG